MKTRDIWILCLGALVLSVAAIGVAGTIMLSVFAIPVVLGLWLMGWGVNTMSRAHAQNQADAVARAMRREQDGR